MFKKTEKKQGKIKKVAGKRANKSVKSKTPPVLKYEIDTRQILLHSRQLFLYGVIDSKIAKELNQEMLALAEINKSPIVLWINSPGGSVPAGFSIIDTIKGMKVPVYTFICGQACSMGGLISIAGKKRIMTSNSIWMAHDIYARQDDYATKLLARVDYTRRLQNQIIKYLQENTKLTRVDINKALNQELWLNAEECTDKGVIDGIAEIK